MSAGNGSREAPTPTASVGQPAVALTTEQAFQQAISFHRQGRIGDAERLYQAILRAAPRHFGALHNLGAIWSEHGRAEEAVRLLRQALQEDPSSTLAYLNLGNALQALGRYEQAIACYERALAIKPDLEAAHNNLGNALLMLGRHQEAIARYERAIALKPDYAEAHYHLGCALQALTRHQEAASCYERAIALRPNYPEAHNNLGNALMALEREEEAIARFERALVVKPDYVEAQLNLANTLVALNRPEAAVARCERAIAISPGLAEAHVSLGQALQALNRQPSAIASYARALALRPDYAQARWQQGQAQLTLGDFENGWRGWEARRSMPTSKTREFPQPLWVGDLDLSGKTIFLYAEPGEGFGDTIQFLRYVPLVAGRGATVVLEVQASLAPALARLEGVSILRAPGDPMPPFDCHCPLMSLPFAFGTRLATIPADMPYIFPSAEKVERWSAAIAPGGSPVIGIAWAGKLRQGKFRNRPIPLRLLEPILRTPGLRFVALQKDLRDGDSELLAALPGLVPLGERLVDFSDTAAAMSLTDLVITVDSAVAHLAGALGKPLWLLLQFAADWRWLLDRADSPWYPSARLFRQPALGDWASVVPRLQSALAEFAR